MVVVDQYVSFLAWLPVLTICNDPWAFFCVESLTPGSDSETATAK